MYVVAVTVLIKPERIPQFIDAILDNARNTRKEPGNLRFDVSQDTEDPGRFLLYEVYQTREDFAAHQQTSHYLRWKNAVTDWMAQPRSAVKLTPLFYGDAETPK